MPRFTALTSLSEGAPLVPRLTSALVLVLGCAPKKAPPAKGLFASVPLPPTQTPPGASEVGLVAFWVACFLPTESKFSPKSLRISEVRNALVQLREHLQVRE